MSESTLPGPANGEHNRPLMPMGPEGEEFSSPTLDVLSRQAIGVPAEKLRLPPQLLVEVSQAIPEPIGPSTVFAIGEKIGRFGFIELGRSRAKLVCASPAACDFDHRLIVSTIQRAAAEDCSAQVAHDPTQPCRRRGGASCTYLVSW